MTKPNGRALAALAVISLMTVLGIASGVFETLRYGLTKSCPPLQEILKSEEELAAIADWADSLLNDVDFYRQLLDRASKVVWMDELDTDVPPDDSFAFLHRSSIRNFYVEKASDLEGPFVTYFGVGSGRTYVVFQVVDPKEAHRTDSRVLLSPRPELVCIGAGGRKR